MIPREMKIKKTDIQIGVWSSICAISGRQTVVPKDSIVLLLFFFTLGSKDPEG